MSKFYTGVGSRQTPVIVLETMTHLAIEKNKQGFVLRSGHANGADLAFELGAGKLKEIWLPWLCFNGSNSLLLPSLKAFALVYKFHPNPGLLKPEGLKLHARNMHQVLGVNLDTPSIELICWTPRGEYIGGTATAIRVAEAYGIPIRNLAMEM